MIILGLNTFGENPSACLVREGKLAAMSQEDRFTRLKGSEGAFPALALDWCLKSQKLSLGDVNRIAVSWDCHKYPWKMATHLARMKFSSHGSPYVHPPSIRHASASGAGLEYLNKHTVGAFENGIRDNLRVSGHHGPVPPIEFVEHHLAHACQAYYQSPFEDAAVLVVDGSGEEHTVSGYAVRNGNMKRVFGYDIPQSLGWYYGAFTAYLGFRANRDEGKLMGLAALGECRREHNPWLERLEKVIRITPEGFELDPLYLKLGGNEFHPRFTDHLYKFVTSYNPDLVPIGVNETVDKDGERLSKYLLDDYVDLAYAVQDRLEEAMVSLARRLVHQTGLKKLCIAGGVAMNCKANGVIRSRAGVEDMFVHPASSDDGAAIGAALKLAADEGDPPRNVLTHVQLGPSYAPAEIEAALQFSGVRYTVAKDIGAETAELLGRGKIMGWFQGGAEMGARALGGRSIIALPKDPKTKEIVNRRVKRREPWRPYCPSMTIEKSNEYLQDPVETPYMILARKATPLMEVACPSAVHVDGTVRPQTVRSEVLPQWHHLIECVGRNSGHPVILNTSFNVRSEPIVCTPFDALRCFFSNGLDALAMGEFLVVK